MSNMEHIVLKNIQKVYPGRICAVHDFSLSIQQGEFLVLVGPVRVRKINIAAHDRRPG